MNLSIPLHAHLVSFEGVSESNGEHDFQAFVTCQLQRDSTNLYTSINNEMTQSLLPNLISFTLPIICHHSNNFKMQIQPCNSWGHNSWQFLVIYRIETKLPLEPHSCLPSAPPPTHILLANIT